MLPGPSPNAATLTYRMPFGNVQSMHVRIVFHSHDCITSDYHPAQPPSLHPARPPPHPLHRVRVTRGRARPRQSVSRLCRRHSATQRDPSSAEAAADESDSHPEVPSYRHSTRLHRHLSWLIVFSQPIQNWIGSTILWASGLLSALLPHSPPPHPVLRSPRSNTVNYCIYNNSIGSAGDVRRDPLQLGLTWER